MEKGTGWRLKLDLPFLSGSSAVLNRKQEFTMSGTPSPQFTCCKRGSSSSNLKLIAAALCRIGVSVDVSCLKQVSI
jgi:hypothetical protein